MLILLINKRMLQARQACADYSCYSGISCALLDFQVFQ